MSVVTGALGSLAPKLLQLLHDEYKLQKGVKKQVEWLSRELNSIYAFLRKVSEVPWDRLDEQVKEWTREVREASYDMEDVLDTFLVRVEGDEPPDASRLKRTMKKMGKVFSKAKARRDIAGAIEDIKKYLEEVAERRQKYKLDESVSKHDISKSTIDPRLTAMYKEVKQLIGIDESRVELMSMLSPSHLDHDVLGKEITKKVSIVGVGGLGKTTLAKAVYDKLRSEYECRAFVSVGRERDLVTVFKDILFHLDKSKYGNIHSSGRGVDLLIVEIREFLENKRYFVVVDDVWDVETCKTIKLALIENCRGSKIITTTRKFDVAEEAGEVYKLKPLSYENSKKLFYTRVFGANGQYPAFKPDDVSDKILKRCAGVPLAITTVSSLLAGKPMEEWSEVYSTIGFWHKDNKDVEATMTILSFSYYDMPSHLQTCLLYLSTYPEDSQIDKGTLIWKWIAEGFVHEKHGEILFELGERYFNDLINRSMIQAVNKRSKRICGCRVHDIVLDLLRKISFEENFIAILDGNAEAISGPSNVRRFALHNRTAEHISSEAKVIKMPKVRSYSAFWSHINNNLVYFPSIRLLRVLDLMGCRSKDGCMLEFGDLLHLRYLGLKYCGEFGIPKLSKQLSNMKLLQTLVLYGVLPVSIVLPTQLLCLHTMHLPDCIGKLTSLEELRIINACDPKVFVKELGNLLELRVLQFITNEMDERMQIYFVESLSKLQKTQLIQLSGSFWDADTATWEAAGFVLPRPLRYLKCNIYFSKLPSCINPSRLPNLSHLSLNVTIMDEQDLKLLARLPALCYLDLKTKSTITASNINAGDGYFFQKLWYFSINLMVQFEQSNQEDTSISLHIWNGEDVMPFASRKSSDSRKVVLSGVMPNLEVLVFTVPLRPLKDNNSDCGNIGLEYLPSLQELRGAINCEGVTVAESDAALAELTNSCKLHPNNLMFHMSKIKSEDGEFWQTVDNFDDFSKIRV